MSIHRTSSGVRTLRAVFENQEPTSPDTRGRSPNGRLTTPGDRPLSKVRTSFVPVDGGNDTTMESDELSKQESQHRTSSGRRPSFSLDESNDATTLERLRSTISEEKEARRESVQVEETVPEEAIKETPTGETPAAVEAKDYMAAGIHQGSKLQEMTLPDEDTPAANPDKPVTAVEEEPGKMQPLPNETSGDALTKGTKSEERESTTDQQSAPTDPAALLAAPNAADNDSANAPAPTPSITETAPAEGAPASTPLRTPKKSTVQKSVSTPATAGKGVKESPAKTNQSAQKPSALSGLTPKPTASPRPSTSGGAPKTPTSAKSPSFARSPTSSRKPAPASLTSPKPATPSTKTLASRPSRSSLTAQTASSAAKAKPQGASDAAAKPSKTSPTAARSRPKSPTRPVKLSSHLLAPTASSAAKHDTQQAKTNGHLSASQRSHPPARAQARPAATGKPAARSSLASSTTKRPESRTGARTAKSTAAPDEGFLARMMRPTQSSAGKLHDKVDAPTHSTVQRAKSVIKGRTAGKPATSAAKKEKSTSRPNTSGKASAPASDAPPVPAAVNGEAAPGGAAPQEASAADAFVDGGATPQVEPDAQEGADTPAFNEATIR
ncbi:hypothetical protein H2203_003408 [Taxawa tesnikishii (nom. ined.)]|nr:hypothetical protein H2203_003408 [Dothideales sp. JES 119]